MANSSDKNFAPNAYSDDFFFSELVSDYLNPNVQDLIRFLNKEEITNKLYASSEI